MNVASQLAAVVEAGRADTAERRRLAEAANLHRWAPVGDLTIGDDHGPTVVCHYTEDATHIAANDPATVLRLCDQEDRHYAAAEELLETHTPGFSHVAPLCEYDGWEWPCDDLLNEAARWGVNP